MKLRLVMLGALATCGRMGFETPHAADAPIDPRGVVALGAHGGAHACVVTADRSVWCWGDNTYGQLGRGYLGPPDDPAMTPVSATSIMQGEASTFAIAEDGTLWGWGLNNDAQLGLGTAGAPVSTPQRIDVGRPVAEVAGGQIHTCARATDGTVACWGANGCGQIGDGTTMPHPTPRTVTGLPATKQIAVHDTLSCALDETGVVRCWGALLDNCASQVPTVVALPPVVQLEGNCHFTICAVDVNGAVWCWGKYIDNNLGNGSTNDAPAPQRVSGFGDAGQPRAVEVGVGFSTNCARTEDHQVLCWGHNTNGELGIGDQALATAPTPRALPVLDGMPIDDLEVGCGFACVRSRGQIYCWGGNNRGQVGDRTTLDRYAPVQVDVDGP